MCLPIFSGRLTSNLRQWYGLPTDGTATTVWWEEEPDPLLASSLQMPTSQSLVPSLSFRFFSPLSLRSNSEKNAVARKFLRVNQPKPDQHLVYDFQLENHHFLWFIVNKLRELFIQGPAKTFSMSKLVVWSARRGKRGTNSIWTLYGPMVASLPCNNGRWRFIAVVSLVLLIAFCGVMTHCFSKRRLQSPFLSAFVIWSRPSLEKLVFDFKTTNRFQYGFHCMSLFTATRLLNKSTKAGLLENVMGFQRVMNKILKVLSDNLPEYLGYEIMAPTIPNYILWSPKKVFTPRYDVAPVELDPCLGFQSVDGETWNINALMVPIDFWLRLRLGSPMSRPRIYILLVRRELLLPAITDFKTYATNFVQQFEDAPQFNWHLVMNSCSKETLPQIIVDSHVIMLHQLRNDLLFPDDHPEVSSAVFRRVQRRKWRILQKKMSCLVFKNHHDTTKVYFHVWVA